MHFFPVDVGKVENRLILKPDDLDGFQNLDTLVFFTRNLRPGQFIKYIVNAIEVKEITLSTYGFDKPTLKTLEMLRRKGKTQKVNLILDSSRYFSRYQSSAYAREIIDQIAITNNHSKIWLFDGPKHKVTVMSSKNLVAGKSKDAGILSTNPGVFKFYKDIFTDKKVVTLVKG